MPSAGRSLDHAGEGAPTCHSVDRSHLLEFAAVHGDAERITKGITRVSPGRTLPDAAPVTAGAVVSVRVAGIVRRARVSRAAFYAHFADKEDCFLAATA